ncbi:OSCP/delta subunit of ATPase [Filobasidium floriforme]|uniref:OSCP/delta subunit of ATPase n=1 Tax=Filobasidium floriforme TaxID=5210 RepID=UPI001E8EEAD6|nr:OSCP/delta subunit of ATPase [Filobasidium floriforme]KAH8089218.1 OSCP/delta subunit of ATPase [Filobasidium floriforme]
MASLSRSLLARGYATASAVKAPVQITSLSGTYATSTYLAAAKKSQKELESVASGLQSIEKKLKDDQKTTEALTNPTLSVSERSKLISSLASGSSPIITNLLQVLASNGRLAAFPSVITDFSTLMAAHRGQLVVTVTSAEPLAAGGAEMKRLEKALKGSKIAQGKDLKLVNRVNPGILGGLEVDFGEQTIDLSASSKVNKFNAALAQGV